MKEEEDAEMEILRQKESVEVSKYDSYLDLRTVIQFPAIQTNLKSRRLQYRCCSFYFPFDLPN
jgi:hypothetical protein